MKQQEGSSLAQAPKIGKSALPREGASFSFSFERSQRVTGLCGQSLFKLPLENTVLEVPRKVRLQSTVLHTHPAASGAPLKVRHHCRQGPGKWLSRSYSPLSGHNLIKLYNRKTPKGPAPLHCRHGPGRWLSRSDSPLSGHNRINLYSRHEPGGWLSRTYSPLSGHKLIKQYNHQNCTTATAWWKPLTSEHAIPGATNAHTPENQAAV